jgi:hypothetical protein
MEFASLLLGPLESASLARLWAKGSQELGSRMPENRGWIAADFCRRRGMEESAGKGAGILGVPAPGSHAAGRP